MEKLQPLLKHKFWIVAGISLVLPFVGWWLNTGAVAENIQSRWETLSSLNVPAGSNTPNDDYIKGLTAVNEVLAERQSELDARLYDEQKSLHTWPRDVARFMDDKMFREPVGDQVLRVYARHHLDEVRGMLDALPQYEFRYDPLTDTIEETGIVYVPDGIEAVPHGPDWQAANTTPVSEEMWNVQEDVWLTRAILNAIKQVNGDAGATKISDAPIRILAELRLRGGSRIDETAAAGGTGEGDGGGDYSPGYGGGGEGDLSDGEGGYSSNRTNFNVQLDVDLDSIFGPDEIQTATGEEGEAGGGGGMPAGAGGGYSEDGSGETPARRYVDDDPELPYKTRGFYLEVVMLHDKLPDLQAALVSMPWPTELLMIQQVSDQADEIVPVKEETRKQGPPGRFRSGEGGFNRGTNFPGRNRFNRNRFGGNREGGRFGGEGGGRFNRPQFNRPRGPMMDREGEGESDREIVTTYQKAMEDFHLTKIGIAGLMTIYRSPEEMADDQADGAPQQNVDSGQPQDTTPEGQDPEAVDPEGQNPDADTTDPMKTDPEATETDETDPEAANPETSDSDAPDSDASETKPEDETSAQPPADETQPPMDEADESGEANESPADADDAEPAETAEAASPS